MTVAAYLSRPFPLPRIARLLQIWLLWTIVGLILTAVSVMYYEILGSPKYWFHLSFSKISSMWAWAAITPFIYRFYRKSDVFAAKLSTTITTYIVSGIVVAVVHRLLSYAIDYGIRMSYGFNSAGFFETMAKWKGFLLYNGMLDFFIYGVLLLVFLLIDSRMKVPQQSAITAPDARDYLQRLSIKDNGKIFFIQVGQVKWIKAEGNYLRIHANGHSRLHRETLKSLQDKLDPAVFYRLNRSFLVNINEIQELQTWFNGEYRVLLKDGTKLNTSRVYKLELNRLLGLK